MKNNWRSIFSYIRTLVVLLLAAACLGSFIVTAERSLDPVSEPRQQNERVRQIIGSSAFAEFDVWTKQYAEENIRGDDEQIRRGATLAIERRQLFNELIRLDPQAALERAIPVETYKRLPSTVAINAEKLITADGDFLVHAVDEVDYATGHLTSSHTERQVVVGDSRYKAIVYGRREAMTTKLNIPLHGIVVDDLMVVDESPVRKIVPTEYAALAVDESKLSENGIAVQVGGEIKYFSSQTELNDYVNEQMEWESKIGLERPSENLAPDSSWTEGPKKVLYIRVDFSDRPGDPIDSITGLPLTAQRAQEEMDKVNTVFTNSSYGRTSFELVTVTPVLRLPQPSSFYMVSLTAIRVSEMMTDARNAARTAGFETNNYDLDVVASVNNGNVGGIAGLGLTGAKGTWLLGFFTYGFPLHEIGHNYGLGHSGVWRTTDGTVTGQGSETGGDLFDAMGYQGFGLPATYFMSSDKGHLDWLTAANVQNVTSDGVYRLFAQDFPNPTNVRLLRIRKDSTRNYDIEFRQTITSNLNAMNGALVRWHYPETRRTQLLDMTPNTNSVADAPLLVGQNLFDDVNRIRITVLGKGNTIPESLDIQVELNIGCNFSLGQTSQNFSATGGGGVVTVNTQSGCAPLATTNNNWISIVDSGTGTLRYIVAAHYGSQPRTGTITISGQTHTVQQSAAITACAARPSGLVAWWRGEGNALDETGVNNGSVQTGITYGAGKVGGGFRGTGAPNNNRIYVPDSPSLALHRSFSIEGWLRLNAPGIYTVIVRSDERDYFGSYALSIINGNFLFGVKSAPNGSGIFVGNPSPVPLNQFVHIAGTLDDTTGQMKFYVNGGLTNETVTSIRPYRDLDPTRNPRIAIGNFAHSSHDSFNGVIDELAVYNLALSATEIQAIYNAGAAATGAAGKCLTSQTSRTPFDYDGDDRSDLSVRRPSNDTWYLLRSTAGYTAQQFGEAGDRIAPADYDGDGKTDVAVFRPLTGTWFVFASQSQTFQQFGWGADGDLPVPTDRDNDGKADLVVFRPSNNTWYTRYANGTFATTEFGVAGDKPLVGDFDADGVGDIALFRPSNNNWYILKSSLGFFIQTWGEAGDIPIPADFDGDGATDQGVFRPSTGQWFLSRTTDGFGSQNWGQAGDIPVAADYDGDGKADVAVFRPTNGTWYIVNSSTGQLIQQFGQAGDVPTQSAFLY